MFANFQAHSSYSHVSYEKRCIYQFVSIEYASYICQLNMALVKGIQHFIEQNTTFARFALPCSVLFSSGWSDKYNMPSNIFRVSLVSWVLHQLNELCFLGQLFIIIELQMHKLVNKKKKSIFN